MHRSLLAALLVLTAAPAFATSEPPRLPVERAKPVDQIFPELDVEGDGWRGLLPIMLMNAEIGSQPRSAGADQREAPAR
jgi:hypothetical protein